jgi:flagellar FliJ protein
VARFVFQLEGVLRHRERLEKERQRDLAIVQAEMMRLEDELKALNQQVRQSTMDVRENHLVGRLDMSYLAAHRRYMLGMQRKALALAQRMAGQQRQVEEAQKALMEASKQRKIMEKLKERRQRNWAAAMALREAGALDELTTQMSYRDLTIQAEGGA